MLRPVGLQESDFNTDSKVKLNLKSSEPLNRRGLNPIKLANDLTSAGWPAQLTAGAFNRLGQYVSNTCNRA